MDPIEQKKVLMKVGPGNPMHDTMRRYWLPICLVSDVAEPDGDPHRVTVLGQDYVVFRDTEGRLGLLDELCTHRSASLCLGRNEQGGLRCLYHGWKFAVDGAIVDAPNVKDPRFKERVRQPSYSIREAGSIVWGYFGPPELEPPMPNHTFFDVPEENRVVEIVASSANYTRLVEGLIDTTHTGVLHQDALKQLREGKGPAPVFGTTQRKVTTGVIAKDLAPTIEVQETDFGFRYAAISSFEENGQLKRQARITSLVHPTTVYIQPDNIVQITLPVDDNRSLFFMVFWSEARQIGVGTARQEVLEYYGIDETGMNKWGLGREYHDLPDRPNRSNNWLQDREAMRRGESFTGMQRFIPEDWGVNQSMGPVDLYPIEHLVPADLAIARYRRQLVDNTKRVAQGEDPLGLSPKDSPKPANIMLDEGQDWRSHFAASQQMG
ncbi:Rieske 2Fe-2S domain-containing protein [Arthrobacter sp. I2-34]|uniref:Rieske 2Fe-2S domain-containing protein n=1 Tax=Arthrobacter hankyongi TaxID=2904801 RepID=A0ABS9L405_9MICC|nr:Rieske 2Fe-2S domain-containing protein [Arthrobacter hankyongi]MCG2621288.1 Rieske 2Fe-2S domain-containing protein [Arthrobacter hankyongi]